MNLHTQTLLESLKSRWSNSFVRCRPRKRRNGPLGLPVAAECLEQRTLLSAVEFAPTVSVPGAEISDTTPTITWNAVTGADRYELQIYDKTAGAMVYWYTDLDATSWTPPRDMASGRDFQVFVRGVDVEGKVGNWNAAVEFRITVNPPDGPDVTGPAAETNITQPSISWNAVDGADHYELQIYDKTAGKLVYWYNDLDATSWTPPQDMASARDFQVFVRGIDASGQAGDWSTPVEFRITVNVAAAPVLVDIGTTSDTTPTISWSTVEGADHYEILIYDKAAGGLVSALDNLGGSSYTAEEVLTNLKEYQVFVRAVDANGQPGQWSSPMEFRIETGVV